VIFTVALFAKSYK
jgi:sodium transport system permease protein